MELMVLIGGILYIGALGFWVTRQFGRFMDGGGIRPSWDAASPPSDSPAGGATEGRRPGAVLPRPSICGVHPPAGQ